MVDHRIAVIPGDGIGPEVTAVARSVLDAVAPSHGLELDYEVFDWSCERYVENGAMMPDDAIDVLRGFDAILLGAVGWPGVPDHVSLWGLLIPIRRAFRQFANVRPARAFAGVDSPVRGGDRLDLVVVRENVEGEYSEIGGRLNRGFPDEMAVQESVFTRVGVTRIVRHAFELAQQRRGRLTSATKSNGIVHTMPFWDEVVREVAEEYPGVEWDQLHIDALAAAVVLDPAPLRRHRGQQSVRRHPLGPDRRRGRLARPRAVRQPRPDAESSRRCSSRCTARRPTSPGRESPTRLRPSGRRR